MSPGSCLLAFLLLASQSSPSLGELQRERGESFLGADAYVEAPLPAFDTLVVSPAVKPHGQLRVRWLKPRLLRSGTFELDYNTDTLAALWHQPEMFGRRTHLSSYVVGQLLNARLLSDHVRAGVQVPERAFHASYVLAGVTGSVLFARPGGAWLWLDAIVGARQWFFTHIPDVDVPLARREGTSPALVLPPDMQVVEVGVRVRANAWSRVSLLGWRQGAWAAARAETHFRTGARTWGDLGTREDRRNDFVLPFPVLGEATLSARYIGEPLLGFARLVFEGSLAGGAGYGLDDVNRFLVGGESPWVVPLAGAAWAEFYADRYAAARVGTGLVLRERFGVRTGLELASVNDPLRRGDLHVMGPLAGAFVDLQWAITERVMTRVRFGHGLLLPSLPGDRRLKAAAGISFAL